MNRVGHCKCYCSTVTLKFRWPGRGVPDELAIPPCMLPIRVASCAPPKSGRVLCQFMAFLVLITICVYIVLFIGISTLLIALDAAPREIPNGIPVNLFRLGNSRNSSTISSATNKSRDYEQLSMHVPSPLVGSPVLEAEDFEAKVSYANFSGVKKDRFMRHQVTRIEGKHGYFPGGIERLKPTIRHREVCARQAEIANQAAFCPQRKFRNWEANPLHILVGSGPRQWENAPGLFNRETKQVEDCNIPCQLGMGSAPNDRDAADVVLSYLPGSTAGKGESACPLQKTARFSMESEIYYASLSLTPENLNEVDFLGTTRLASDIPMIYGSFAEYNFMAPPIPLSIKAKTEALAVMFISNCGDLTGRLEVASALMQAGITIHSYGRCLNNRQVSDATFVQGEFATTHNEKSEIIRYYKFVLAFENTEAEDYVTEKLFQVFVAGAIPIVLGASNAVDFAPSDHALIHANDFESIDALAEYLRYLDTHDEAYNQYIDFKEKGFSPQFLRFMAATTDMHSLCRLCHAVRQLQEWETGTVTCVGSNNATTIPPCKSM